MLDQKEIYKFNSFQLGQLIFLSSHLLNALQYTAMDDIESVYKVGTNDGVRIGYWKDIIYKQLKEYNG